MYIPAWFKEQRLETLHALIRRYPFAPLVTEIDGAPFAGHFPFLLDSERGEFGTLRAHIARLNPQWRGFGDGKEALVLFQGPHAYISPTWYAAGPAVPTWNYAVAHAYGVPRVVDDTALRAILLETVATFEGQETRTRIPEEYFAKMALGVVGFEIEITRLEGKFKLSQNRSEEDRRRVIRALQGSRRVGDRDTAEQMLALAPETRETA